MARAVEFRAAATAEAQNLFIKIGRAIHIVGFDIDVIEGFDLHCRCLPFGARFGLISILTLHGQTWTGPGLWK
jgi:hypothetical protein